MSRVAIGPRLLVVAAGALALGACNLIFGIDPGEGSGQGGASSTSHGSGGTAGAMTASSSTASSSGTASSSSSSSGQGGGCGFDAGTPEGKGYEFRPTNADGGDWASACAFDGEGNLVVAGNFAFETIDLGGGPHTLPPKSYIYDHNFFVAKYSPTNTHLWSRAFGGDKDSIALAAAVAPNGDVWVTGNFAGTMDIGGTVLTYDHFATDPDYEDMFVVKLDKDGNVVFAKRFGNEYKQFGMGIAVDSGGNAVVAGAGWGVMSFGLTSPFGVDAVWSSFALKLAPDGAPLWVDSHLHWTNGYAFYPEPNREMAVAIDKNDDVLLAGNFDGQAYFGDQIDAPLGGVDAYVLKLDKADGALVWKRFVHGPAASDGDQWPTAIATDRCTGDVYVAGAYRTGVEVDGLPAVMVSVGDPSADDMFLLKLAGGDGAPLRLDTFGDAGFQRILGVSVDPAGNVVLAGEILDAEGFMGVNFGPEIGTLKPLVTPDPDAGVDYRVDLFVVKLDPSGKGLWGYRLGDQWDQLAWSVATDSAGNIGLAGEFDGTLKLPGLQPYSSNYYDAFVGWMRP